MSRNKKVNCRQLGKDKAASILKKLYGAPSETNNKVLSQKNIANKFAQDPDTKYFLDISHKSNSPSIMCIYVKGFENGLIELCHKPCYNNNSRDSTKFTKEVIDILLTQEFYLMNQEYANLAGATTEHAYI